MEETIILIIGGLFIPLFLYLLSRIHDLEELGNRIMEQIMELGKWVRKK